MLQPRRIATKLSEIAARLAMEALHSKSLGWEKLSRSPKLTTGHIFDHSRQALPWFTYPAIAQLLRMNLSEQVLLEYGCGSSTAFFVRLGCKVKSIEHNADWANMVNRAIGAGSIVCTKLATNDYVQTADQLSRLKPSIIVVDGAECKECCSEIATYLQDFKESESLWMVILDNSDWHGAPYSILMSCKDLVGFDYYGHGPNNAYSWCTTLFLRPDLYSLRKIMMDHKAVAKPMNNGIISNFSNSL